MDLGVETFSQKGQNKVVGFQEEGRASFGLIIASIAAVLAIAGTAYFWLSDRSVKSALAEKQTERDTIMTQIDSQSYKDVEKVANDFKAAVTGLKQAKAERYSMADFLSAFYKHILKNVKVDSIAVGKSNDLSFSGKAGSYRDVSEQLLALSNWPELNKVKLGTVSLAANDAGKVEVSFNITAKLNKTATPTPSPSAAPTQ